MSSQTLRARFREAVSDAILAAAEELAAEVGLQNAGLQAIAQKAGVSVGTIYNYFADRNELFEAVFKRLRNDVVMSVDTSMKTVAREPFEVQLDTFVRTVLTVFDDRRNALRVSIDAEAYRIRAEAGYRPAKAMEELRLRAERVVRTGVKEKRLKSEGSELFPLFLVSALKAILLARIEETTPFASGTDAVVAFFLEGAGR